MAAKNAAQPQPPTGETAPRSPFGRFDPGRCSQRCLQGALEAIGVIEFMPEAHGCRSTIWLIAITIDPAMVGRSNEYVASIWKALDI
jgi:hypothetical protein